MTPRPFWRWWVFCFAMWAWFRFRWPWALRLMGWSSVVAWLAVGDDDPILATNGTEPF